ncbi:hypothetical protein ACFY1A_48260 [Streptomyces sp. NPDC001520]|uniref:hypothetical protein n=1 Tax=Streptomyces sp. NPDC001520 TaxID=3364581 RepID=UPI0036904137
MKFKTETRHRMVPREIDGVTNMVRQPYTVPVPVVPRDWDVIAIRAAVGLVLTLTAAAVVWSTVSIGDLLGGGVVGLAAAAVFDLAWAVNVLMEYLARFDPKKRTFAKILGWVLLPATMGALFWHGFNADNIALAVVGAGVSLVAKVLWLGVMRFIDRDLSPEDQAWVEAEVSKANAKLAVGGVRRMAARADARAAAELMAAERIRSQVAELSAPVPPASDEVYVEAPRNPLVFRRAVEAVLADTADEEATAAIEAATANGWKPREVYNAAMDTHRKSADALPGNPGQQGNAREGNTKHLFRTPGQAPAARPGNPGTEAGAPRAASIAGTVRELLAKNVDRDTVIKTVPGLVGKDVPPADVKREIRRQLRTASTAPTAATAGRTRPTAGPYL